MKFLHISDLHIGKKFINKSEVVRKKLRQSLILTFKDISKYVIEEKLDALIISGDLFDEETVSFNSENLVLDEFRKISDAGVKIFYCTGNHDYSNRIVLYEKMKEEKNIFMFLNSNIERKNFISRDGDRFTVIGCGYESKKFNDNLISKYPIKLDENIHIGIAHTMVSSINGEKEDNYMPCSMKDLKERNYDYFALGHIHKRMCLDEESRIWYSGNPMGLNYKEIDEKGGNLVKISEGNIEVEFIKFGNVVWRNIEVIIDENIMDMISLIKIINNSIENLKLEKLNLRDEIIRITLSGRTYFYDAIQNKDEMNEILEEISYKHDILDINLKIGNLVPIIDVEEYLIENNLLSNILQSIEDDVKAENLLKYFVDHKFLSKKYKSENIKDLIKNSRNEVIKRMIKY